MQNEIYYLIGMLIIVAIALVYNLHGLWIVPEKHVTKLVSGVKDWWPFASFYRRWFASKAFLWLFRIMYTVFLVIVMTILSLTTLGTMGVFP